MANPADFDITKNGVELSPVFKMVFHRFRLDIRDIAPVFAMLNHELKSGALRYYRHRKSGVTAIGVNCGSCPMHHPLIEIETIGLEDSSTIHFDTVGCENFTDIMRARDGVIGSVPAAPLPAHMIDVIEAAQKKPRIAKFDAERAFYRIFIILRAFESGTATLGFDTRSGRTAIALGPNHRTLLPMFLVAMPKCDDLREEADFVAIKDPFAEFELTEEKISKAVWELADYKPPSIN